MRVHQRPSFRLRLNARQLERRAARMAERAKWSGARHAARQDDQFLIGQWFASFKLRWPSWPRAGRAV